MNKKLRGDLLLFIAALIWGASFVAQKAGMEYIGPFTFNGIRFILGSLVLVPVILIMDCLKKRSAGSELGDTAKTEAKDASESETKRSGKDLVFGGLSCGVVLFIAGTLQQIGMIYTTAGKAGFITALYIVLVPICGLFTGRKVRHMLWFCVALATIGLYFLSIKEDFSISMGDLLMIAGAFGFTAHILAIDHFSPKADGIKLSCLQFFTAGLLSLPGIFLFETVNWNSIIASLQPILYTAVLSCGVAYTLQIVAQKDTEPAMASLILSFESVFAVISGILLLNEQVTSREIWGCLIMFAAILLAQLPLKKEDFSRLQPQLTDYVSTYLKKLPARDNRSS